MAKLNVLIVIKNLELDKIIKQLKNFKTMIKVGHRGAAGYEPENTLASFQKAIDLGVDMVELDVHICKTGELVVIHEYFTDGTKNGRNFISELSLTELKTPTLNQVLDLIDKKVKVNIELKGRNTAEPVVNLIKEYVKNSRQYDDFLVSSFLYDELEKTRELDKNIKIGVLTKDISRGFIEFSKKIQAYSLNMRIDCINKEIVENAHKDGFKVFIWTADTAEEIEKAKEIGADYICSNYPDKI